MSEKNNILYLCVCMALSDHKLDNSETAEIIKISKKLNIKFHVQDAAVEINNKFKDDLDTAQDFYSGNIQEIENRKIAKEFVKDVAISNGDLKDKEVRFMVRLKHAWGRHIFDS
tara:strand:- start:5 stop:346 length:342 start_codon:yes stop_codon:yes gene_type:complete